MYPLKIGVLKSLKIIEEEKPTTMKQLSITDHIISYQYPITILGGCEVGVKNAKMKLL